MVKMRRRFFFAWALSLPGRGPDSGVDPAPLLAVDVSRIFDTNRSRGGGNWTGVVDEVDAGCSIGIVSKGDTPSVKMNFPASRSEGFNFNSRFAELGQLVPDTKA